MKTILPKALLCACASWVACAATPWYRHYGLPSQQAAEQPAARPQLARALRSGDLEHAEQAARALLRMGMPGLTTLAAAAQAGQGAAIVALGEAGPRAAPAVGALLRVLARATAKSNRRLVVQTLGRIGTPAVGAAPVLVRLLAGDESRRVRREAARTLAAIEATDRATLEALASASRDASHRVRTAARRALQTLRLLAAQRPAAPRPAAPLVAVFPLEDATKRLDVADVAQLSSYLEARLTALGVFRVVPAAQLRARLASEKRESYRRCYDTRCQIELGRALAARKALVTRLLSFGGAAARRCTLTTRLYDLRSEAAERAATTDTACTTAALREAVDRLIGRLGAEGSKGAR